MIRPLDVWQPQGERDVERTEAEGAAIGDWARGLHPVTRSRAQARTAYDRASRWSRAEEPFERRARGVALDLLGIRPGERVLEIGCGAGGALVAVGRAVGPAGRVVGLDLSPGMIQEAGVRLRRAGLADRAELLVGDACSIPCADASFDSVFLSFTLELFDTPEIPAVLGECRRILRPGGRIGVVSLSRSAPVRWPTHLYEWLHDRFPATLDCRPIHPRLAVEAAGFEQAHATTIPLWGLRAEAVVAVRGAAAESRGGAAAGPRVALEPAPRPLAPVVTTPDPGVTPPDAAPVPQPRPPGGLPRALLGLPVHLYHARLGFLLGRRFLLLVHTGRRTGIQRESVLEVIRYDPVTREVVVAAGWGRRTGWLHNVEAGLAREVWLGRERFVPAWRVLGADEAERLFADYERRNRFMGPIVRAVVSRLVGWHYDGTSAARRRVVEQLSLVGFRPRTPS